MRTLFIVIVTFFYSLTVFGTAQISDKIIYHGKEYKLNNNPMDIYFKQYSDKIQEDVCISIELSVTWKMGYDNFNKDSTVSIPILNIAYRNNCNGNYYFLKVSESKDSLPPIYCGICYFPCSLEIVTLCRLAAILSPSNYLYMFYLYNQKLKKII